MIKKILVIISLIVVLIFSICSFRIDNNTLNKYINVEIRGEVVKEKIIKLPLGSTFSDALKHFELTNDSDISTLSYSDVLYNNQIIDIPKKGTNRISINNADIDLLVTLPGIGNKIAQRIIEYRNTYGSFTSLEELKNVQGIGDKIFEKIKSYICL